MSMFGKYPVRLIPWCRPFDRRTEFALVSHTGELHYVAKPIEMVIVPEGECIPGPTFSLADDEVQALMDKLWDCGYRPTQGTQSFGQIEAMEKHLADMRAIVANRLKVKL